MVWWKRKKTFRVKSHPLSHRLLGYGFKEIWRSDLIDIFQAEHDLRMLVQREEALERKVKALVKTASIDDKLDQTQLEEIKTELQGLQPKITMHEYYLYRAEGELSPAFGSLYTKLRLNPKWFMRPGMVSDCANRGGCCSRGCGCCERRLLGNREKGVGHCTTECSCCENFRGFALPDADKKYISDDLITRLNTTRGWERSSFCVVMANWYFCPLEATLEQ